MRVFLLLSSLLVYSALAVDQGNDFANLFGASAPDLQKLLKQVRKGDGNPIADLLGKSLGLDKDMMGIVGALGNGGKKECAFQCGVGEEVVENSKHIPSSNGCGVDGFTLNEPLFKFTPCCDTHDFCYEKCQSVRRKCDLQFRTCLFKYCDAEFPKGSLLGESINTDCRERAQFYYGLVKGFGCGPFLTSQANACTCANDGHQPNASKGRGIFEDLGRIIDEL